LTSKYEQFSEGWRHGEIPGVQIQWTSMVGGKKVKDGMARVDNLFFLKELTGTGKLKSVYKLSVGANGRGFQVCRERAQKGKCSNNCGT